MAEYIRTTIEGVQKGFGSYSSLEEAQNRRNEVRKELFGEFWGRL